jgi:hypothetical protein
MLKEIDDFLMPNGGLKTLKANKNLNATEMAPIMRSLRFAGPPVFPSKSPGRVSKTNAYLAIEKRIRSITNSSIKYRAMLEVRKAFEDAGYPP